MVQEAWKLCANGVRARDEIPVRRISPVSAPQAGVRLLQPKPPSFWAPAARRWTRVVGMVSRTLPRSALWSIHALERTLAGDGLRHYGRPAPTRAPKPPLPSTRRQGRRLTHIWQAPRPRWAPKYAPLGALGRLRASQRGVRRGASSSQ
eukprot:scaffold1102_cov395-Prasinococcus_capsulatus_cf.AAC.1